MNRGKTRVIRRTDVVGIGLAGALVLSACRYDLDRLRGTLPSPDGPSLETTDAGKSTATDAGKPATTDAGTTPDAAVGLPESFPERPSSPPIPAGAVGAADLVAYWPLDEGQGGYAWDVTGNGNDGVLLLGANWRPTGFPGALFQNTSALQFDGIAAFAEFVPKTVLDIEAPRSLSLWVRYDYEVDPARAQALFVLLNRTKSAGLRLEFRGGRLIASTYFYKELVGLPAPSIGWHHIVYTYDGNTHALFVDGNAPVTAMGAAEVGPTVKPDGRGRIGRSSSGVDDAFRGFIDDVRLYKRALTAAEVKSLSLGAP